jgi:hypothetical protein
VAEKGHLLNSEMIGMGSGRIRTTNVRLTSKQKTSIGLHMSFNIEVLVALVSSTSRGILSPVYVQPLRLQRQ